MCILRVNRSKTKHCVFHNGMITWNSLPDIFKVKVSFSMFKSKVKKFLSGKILENINAGRHYDCIIFSDMLATAVFQVQLFLVLGILL